MIRIWAGGTALAMFSSHVSTEAPFSLTRWSKAASVMETVRNSDDLIWFLGTTSTVRTAQHCKLFYSGLQRPPWPAVSLSGLEIPRTEHSWKHYLVSPIRSTSWISSPDSLFVLLLSGKWYCSTQSSFAKLCQTITSRFSPKNPTCRSFD